MSLHSLQIKDGKFVLTYKDMCKHPSPYEVNVEDWNCCITEKGIVCTCSKQLDKGFVKLKYTILKNGFSRLTLKVPGCNYKILKKQWVSKPGTFDFNGILTLSCGDIYKRQVGFKVIK